jgi:hypothetical protein
LLEDLYGRLTKAQSRVARLLGSDWACPARVRGAHSLRAGFPLGARVVAVCDSFDAMTTERPYREPVTETEAIEELRRCSGAQFDPMVVEAFCRVIARERLDLGEFHSRA